MIMWLILIALVGALGWLGGRLGAVRMSINILGLMVSTWAGFKFGPKLMNTFAKIGDGGNPLLLYLAPVLVVFLVSYIVFLCLSYVTGDQVYLYYKYKIIDDKRMAWEKMNSKVGMCLGVASAITHFAVLGLLVYTMGYWTTQLHGEGGGSSGSGSSSGGSSSSKAKKVPSGGGGMSTLVSIANPLRASLAKSGLEKFIASLDPLPANFYALADVVGLVYHNPSAARRFLSYPGTIGLAELPEFQAMAADDFQTTWAAKPELPNLLITAQSRALFKNLTLLKQVTEIDAKDAYDYLLNGKSDKYKDEPILGRWEIHLRSTLPLVGTNNPAVLSDIATLSMLRQNMARLVNDIALLATPESQVLIKGRFENEKPLVDMLNGRVPSVRTNSPNTKTLITGTWKKEAGNGKYSVTFGTGSAKAESLEIAQNKSMTLSFSGGTLIFTKAD